MSTPNTPGEGPASGGPPAQGPNANRARAKGPNQTAGEVAGRSADAARSEQARSEQARTMRDRVSQQEAAAAEAVTKERPAAQRPSSAPKGPAPQRGAAGPAAGPAAGAPRPPLQRTQRPVVTGTAAPRGQQGTPVPSTAPDSRAPKPNAASAKVTVPKVTAPKAPDPTAAETADVVDAPTSHISRSKVPTTGMQDLSTVQHPSTAAADAGREHQEARPRPVVSVGSRRGRGPLRASMQLRSIDPWSTLKISLLLSVALFFVWLVAVGIIYLVLDGMGVWDRLNTGVVDIMSNSDSVPTLIGPGQVFGVAAIIGIINVVLFTAMTTIGAFVYNISAEAVGGVEVTLADRD